MKRITLILGVVAVMAVMMVALAAPAMAKDKAGHNKGGDINRLENRLDRMDNRLDNRLDRVDNRVDLDDGDFLATAVDRSPFFISTNNVNSCWFWNSQTWVWACASGAEPVITEPAEPILTDFVDVDDVGFDRVNVDFDRGIHFTDGNNHNGNAHHNSNGKSHNGGGGKKGNGK